MSCTCPAPASASAIYKNECALCFRVPNLLELCLTCLESFCPADLSAHSAKHPSHSQFLTIETIFPEPAEKESIPKQPRLDSIRIPATEPTPEPQRIFSFKCTKCSIEGLTDFSPLTPPMAELCKLVMQSPDASIKSQQAGDAWTEPSAQVCEHSLGISQEPIEPNEAKCCAQCTLDSNLWMCLICGALGCGRRQFDGSGGNGHALDHFKASGHPVAIKLGTILYRGQSEPLEADLYCYACDDAVIDLELPAHLRALGIDPSTTEKTEKSITELQLHLNLTHSYSMLDESGSALPSLDGPGRRGMINLGNSCYIASVLQALRGLDELQRVTVNHNYEQCQKERIASKCLLCQLRKLETSLESFDQGEYSIKPTLLKALLTAGHAEFSSSRQQDASEFLNFLLEESRSPFNGPVLPHFSFQLAQVLKCEGCGQESVSCSSQNALQLSCVEDSSRVELMNGFFASESLERVCEHCNHGRATKRVHLASLPKHFCVISSRLRLRNWIPEKVDCRLSGMAEDLKLSSQTVQANSVFKVNEEMLGELLLMGFEEAPARAALTACKNASIEAAMDQMYNSTSFVPVSKEIDPNAVEMGVAAGFEREAVLAALESCNGDLESAMNMLLNGEIPISETTSVKNEASYKLKAFITHQGSSMHCGHYVAHLNFPEDGWVLFNDEKVAKAKEDDASFPIEKAYIYLYTQQ